MTQVLLSILSFLLCGSIGGVIWLCAWVNCGFKHGSADDSIGDAYFVMFTTPFVAVVCGILGVVAYIRWQ